MFFKNLIKKILKLFGYQLIRINYLKKLNIDYYLYNYSSDEEYKSTQIKYNKQKLDNVWADEETMNKIGLILTEKYNKNSKILGLCHGTRNGFEQNFLNDNFKKLDVIGTDISPTVSEFKNSIQWDFHEINSSWVNKFDFVYSNSLDQSNKPKEALKVWLNQLKKDGILIVEHSNDHGPQGASKMDPFGVKPNVFSHLMIGWFGQQISIDLIKSIKSNSKIPIFIFLIKKNISNVTVRDIKVSDLILETS